MAESNDVAELIRKIAEITNSTKYKTLSSSHRDAPQQREMDRMNLHLTGYRARLAQLESASAAPTRRPTGAVMSVSHDTRPVLLARLPASTLVTVPDEPKVVPRRPNAFVQRREPNAPLMTAESVALQAPAPVVTAAAVSPGNSMAGRRGRPAGSMLSNNKRGNVGPIVTVISEPAVDNVIGNNVIDDTEDMFAAAEAEREAITFEDLLE